MDSIISLLNASEVEKHQHVTIFTISPSRNTYVLHFYFDGTEQNLYMEEHLQELLQDPDYRINHEEKLRRLQQIGNQNIRLRMDCSNPVILPVAVHFQGVSNPDRSCLEAQAIDQIRIANEDFKGINADISIWLNEASAFFREPIMVRMPGVLPGYH